MIKYIIYKVPKSGKSCYLPVKKNKNYLSK